MIPALLIWLSAAAWSQEELEEVPAPAPSVQVEWYLPEMRRSEKKNRSRVLLSGKTLPASKIAISKDVIPLINKKGDVKMIRLLEVWPEKEAQADERGIFELNLDLPFMTAQLPIEVTAPDGASRRYQLSMVVDKKDVKLTNQKDAKKSPYARRKWGLWGGIGVNYLRYNQESDIPSSLILKSFDLPTIYGKVVRSITPELAVQFTANRAPGKTSSSENVRISQGEYNWTYLTGEVTFFHPSWKFRYKKYFSELGAQVGIQYHIVPFFARSSTTDPTTASVETNDIFLQAFGLTWLIHYGRYWLFETFMRYQTPYASGSLFDIEYKFAFDGSVGVIYKWKPDWRVGVFWYGQWHEYRFTNHRDKYFEANGGGGPNISGDQTLFFSNIEARIGWEFD